MTHSKHQSTFKVCFLSSLFTMTLGMGCTTSRLPEIPITQTAAPEANSEPESPTRSIAASVAKPADAATVARPIITPVITGPDTTETSRKTLPLSDQDISLEFAPQTTAEFEPLSTPTEEQLSTPTEEPPQSESVPDDMVAIAQSALSEVDSATTYKDKSQVSFNEQMVSVPSTSEQSVSVPPTYEQTVNEPTTYEQIDLASVSYDQIEVEEINVEEISTSDCPQIAELKPLSSGGCTLTLEAQQAITFKIGSDILTESAFGVLDTVLDAFSYNPNLLIEVAAHTDNRGNPDNNLTLSKRRGIAVARYLQSRGIELDQITARAFAGEKPIANNNTANGRRANRRVEFKFLL